VSAPAVPPRTPRLPAQEQALKWKLAVVLLPVVPAFASAENDEKKARDAQAEELVPQAKDLEQSGELVEARKRYASSPAFWETKDAKKAIKHSETHLRRRKRRL
jgi:hypothetical protein